MELIKFEYNKGTTYCPKCNEDTDCPECYAKMDFCRHCGETIEKHDCFIIITLEKYHGWDSMSIHTATLIIDGKDYATAHIEEDKEDKSADIAHMQLLYIPEDKQTETIASIIAAFAKWVRFDWNPPEKNTDLPILVRLIGYTIDKRYRMPWSSEVWVALWNALEIKKEHLAWEFTSKEIV